MDTDDFGWRRFRPRVERFISEYLKDFNGAKAAERAGYSPKSARYQASKLLRDVAVSKEITARFESELRDNNASISRIVRELSLVAFCDPGKMLDESGHLRPLHELPEEVRHGLLGVTLTEYRSENGEKPARIVQKFRFDKLTALNLLVKHYGMVTNNLAGDDYEDDYDDDC